jgi:hypothetical protein
MPSVFEKSVKLILNRVLKKVLDSILRRDASSDDKKESPAAGVRWLHHKKKLAENRLKRRITWEEAGAEYKGIFNQIGKDDTADRIMRELRSFHKQLKDRRK